MITTVFFTSDCHTITSTAMHNNLSFTIFIKKNTKDGMPVIILLLSKHNQTHMYITHTHMYKHLTHIKTLASVSVINYTDDGCH